MGGVEIERRFSIQRRFNLVWSSSVFLGAEGGAIYEEVRSALYDFPERVMASRCKVSR